MVEMLETGFGSWLWAHNDDLTRKTLPEPHPILAARCFATTTRTIVGTVATR